MGSHIPGGSTWTVDSGLKWAQSGLGQITWSIVLAKKLMGYSGKKIAQKPRNSCKVNGRGCGFIGTVDLRRTFVQSCNQIQTLKECLSCHIYCAQLRPRLPQLLQPLAQSLIGSPGTLAQSRGWSLRGYQD